MHRVDAASLASFAYHRPEVLDQERERLYLEATPAGSYARVVARAQRMIQEVEQGAVLADG